MWTSKHTQVLGTFAISGFGALVFNVLGLPLPFLFGPMFASLLAALIGAPLKGGGQISVAARTILGVAVGASITPAVLADVPNMVLSVALVPLYLICIAAVGIPFFVRVCGFDRVTAYYSAMPGGLMDMVIFGQEAGGNVRALSLVHATRVLVIVTLAPFILSWGMGVNLSNPVGAPASELPVHEMVIMCVAALIGWRGGVRIGLFGAAILGPIIVAAILSLTDVLHSRPPAEAINAAQFFIGMGIGVGYAGVTVAELRRFVAAGIAYVLMLATLAVVFGEIVVLSGLANPLEGFLAFSPGGQAEMTVLAIIAGADLGFVVVHHLTRLILVITGAPFFAKALKIGAEKIDESDEGKV